MQENTGTTGTTGTGKTDEISNLKQLSFVGPFTRDEVIDAAMHAYDESHSGTTFTDLAPENQELEIRKAVDLLTNKNPIADREPGITAEDREFGRKFLGILKRNPRWDDGRFAVGYRVGYNGILANASKTQEDSATSRR